MTSVATSNWELVSWKQHGHVHVAVHGPETMASVADVPDEAESFGISFAHGTVMRQLTMPRLVDRHLENPVSTHKTVLIAGDEWELPNFDNAEEFVGRLVRAGVLLRDPLIEHVVSGEAPRIGVRTIQRRVAAATGMTQGTIRQIERARRAALLLRGAAAPLDVVHRLGYYDQPHLARSLTRFIGRTATQLREQDVTEPLSLLYKNESVSTA